MGERQVRPIRTASASSGTRRILTFVITEEIAQQRHFHWSSIGEQQQALCGVSSMPAGIDERFWGALEPETPNLSWCEECAQLKQQILPDLGIQPPRAKPGRMRTK